MDASRIITNSGRTWTFDPEEQRSLLVLRRRYRVDPDMFSDCERAKLSFFRWLVNSGGLQAG